MDLGIAGRKAIVCASSKGLGRACAMALAEAGCVVIVNGRDAATLQATARAIREASGAEVVAVAGDLDTLEVRAALLEACPAPDILVNNNGGPPPAPFAELRREDILRGVESNMLTPIALIQQVAPGMARRRFGRIVNITSSSVRAPIAGLDVSSGARAGLTAFVAASARAFAKDNVTINSIQPGAFDTDRLRPGLARRAAELGGDLAAARAEREARIPAGRFGAPPEFGALCAYLCSAQAGYVTGQNILIDGGAFPGAF
jgi:3-oxoacyl-[acyl-carrier protein] reductase